jgi:hypothetical protein
MARSEMRVGVLVYDFRAAVAQSGRKLRVRVVVGAASTADASRRIVVRAGRCTSGELSFPDCPPEFTRSLVVPRGRLAYRSLRFALRRPPARLDTIRITVNRPGEVTRARPVGAGAAAAYAQLLLRGSAWRDSPRTLFGLGIVRKSAVRLTALRADAAALSSRAIRPSFEWAGIAADSVVVLSDERTCGTPDCAPARSLRSTLRAGVEHHFFDRPELERGAPPGLGLDVTAGDRRLGTVRLPWPG